ncbi:diacylglycerol kinase [Congregibacter variabilis]|uniref:Diacylglycerol kinase n=1 Tax=Congregibacter variabilis TaxID=3081200 RepID=A0ABZ0I4Y3_9GAMM|nr:diacylglycerol kinase [Congregibacter sp. IMCC43200]
MNKPNGKGPGRILKAALCTYKGFGAALRHEAAFRQELFLVTVLCPLAFYIAETGTQLLMLLLSLILLLLTELVNSALEALADAISLEHNELLGRAKDMGSAAVFLAMLFTTLVFGDAIHRCFFAQ